MCWTMLSILFLLMPILPSSYSLPQGSPSKPLQGVNNDCVTAPSPSRHRDTGGNPPNVGAKCVFPFHYKGQTYHECAFGNVTSSLPENYRWCSTRVQTNRTHVRGQGEWGFCSSECFLLDGSFLPYKIDEQTGYRVSGIPTRQVTATLGSTIWINRPQYNITNMPQELLGSTLFQPATHYVDISTIEVFSARDAIIYVAVYEPRDGGLMELLPVQGWTLRNGWFVEWNRGPGERLHKIWSKPVNAGETISFTTSENRMTFALFITEVPPHLITFAVDTTIQFRYARTRVHLEAVNPSKVSQEFPFSLTLPETAFVMNMSLIYDGAEHVARVEEKELALSQFTEAVEKGETAAQVKKTERDSKKLTVDVNIEPRETISLVVTYEELLDRKVGRYEYSANINPGGIVDNYTINIQINESLPIKDLFSFYDSENINAVQENVFKNPFRAVAQSEFDMTASLTYNPSRQEQERFGRDGITGKINVEYDVERNNEDNIVQVLDGYFVHFFAPENEDPLPKHIIFVLDTSGSMKGIKIDQLKNAMVTVLEELADQDYISIISFNSLVDIWSGSGIKQVQEVRDAASRYILQLEAEGGTNINDALVEAVSMANNLRSVVENVTPIIFFLTDGRATTGQKNTEAILRSVGNRNLHYDVPIFSLAFGADADFTLLRDISLGNFGFAKKIYEGVDADIQLEGFYQTIATPLLKNVKFEYLGDIWETTSLSGSSTIPTIFKGGENIVVGKLSSEYEGSISRNQISIGGEGADGRNKYNNSLKFDEITNVSPSSNINFLERLWAYKIIKRLLATEPKDPRKEATNLALKYNFVTELTSLIVTKPGEEEAEVKPVPISAEVCKKCENKDVSHSIDDVTSIAGSTAQERPSLQLPPTEELYELLPKDPTTTTTPFILIPSSCNITIFTKTYNRGDHQTFTEDQENLGLWDNKAVSLKVNGECCWMVFTQVNYSGNSKLFCERAYNSATDLGFVYKDASSFKYVVPFET